MWLKKASHAVTGSLQIRKYQDRMVDRQSGESRSTRHDSSRRSQAGQSAGVGPDQPVRCRHIRDLPDAPDDQQLPFDF